MMMPTQMYYSPPSMHPYGYPMMPPQAYMGAPQNNTANEKSQAAVAPPSGTYSNLAGFYAPVGPSGVPQEHGSAPLPLPPRHTATASDSA
jgi:hypothetical protein